MSAVLPGLGEQELARTARTATTGEAHAPYLPAHRRAMRRALVAVSIAVVAGRASEDDRRAVDDALDALVATQQPSGLFAGGDNGESPPDSAFTANDVCRALRILTARPVPGLEAQERRLREIAARVAPPLAVGGVHTPNHRWEIASALAALGDVLGDPGLTAAAEVWLSEGVDIDQDGMFSERSANYAAHVSGPCLLVLSRLLGREDLADAVERNLRATLPLIDDRGRVETLHSRRQDQTADFDAEPYLPLLLWAARRTHDGRFVPPAEAIVLRGFDDPGSRLAEVLDAGESGALPPASPAPASESTVLERSGLVRWRDRDRATTVFGGSDFAATGRIASGLSNSSTLLRARSGALELRALRISPDFFGIGALRPRLTDADERRAVLEESRAAAFYGPLPRDRRDPDGGYPLTPDGRFFAAMDFSHRPQHRSELKSRTVIDRTEHGFEATVSWQGPDAPVAVELVFPADHTVTGAVPRSSADALVPSGDDFAVRAPDGAEMRVRWSGALPNTEDVPISFDEGESFTAVGGSDRVDGTRVLIPARTSSEFRLVVRFGTYAL